MFTGRHMQMQAFETEINMELDSRCYNLWLWIVCKPCLCPCPCLCLWIIYRTKLTYKTCWVLTWTQKASIAACLDRCRNFWRRMRLDRPAPARVHILFQFQPSIPCPMLPSMELVYYSPFAHAIRTRPRAPKKRIQNLDRRPGCQSQDIYIGLWLIGQRHR